MILQAKKCQILMIFSKMLESAGIIFLFFSDFTQRSNKNSIMSIQTNDKLTLIGKFFNVKKVLEIL